MEELIRTNDLVLISFIEALMKEAGIACLVFDQHMSTMEGSMGFLQRRVLVDGERREEARQLVRDAGVDVALAGPPG